MIEEESIAREHSHRFHPEVDEAKLAARYATLDERFKETLEQNHREAALADDRLSSHNFAEAWETMLRRQEWAGAGGLPTDVFIESWGEAPDRAMTKMGGLPFWPANRPWPRNWLGQHLPYVGQINFTDSKDIVDDLPGDVLVLFAGRIFGGRLIGKWVRMAECTPIAPSAVPPQRREFPSCHYAIHRTYDPPAGQAQASASADEAFGVITGIKIGGSPFHYDGKTALSFLFQILGLTEAFDKDCCPVEPGMTDGEAEEVEIASDPDDVDIHLLHIEIGSRCAFLRPNGGISWKRCLFPGRDFEISPEFTASTEDE